MYDDDIKIKLTVWRMVGLIVILSHFVYSQSFLAQNYTTSNGRRTLAINDVTQDCQGTMWFASARGVSSYDGSTWSYYSRLEGLPDSEYAFVLSDKQNNIWALSRNLHNGIFRFNGIRWIEIRGPGNILTNQTIPVTCAGIIDNGADIRIGIGTAGNGFYLYDYKKNLWIHSLHRSEPPGTHVYAMDVLKETFLVSSINGLFQLDPFKPDHWAAHPIAIPSFPIRSIAVEKSGNQFRDEDRVWLTGDTWVGYYFPRNQHSFCCIRNGSFPGVTFGVFSSIVTVPDRFGGLWVGCRKALFHIDAKGNIRNYGTRHSFVTDGVLGLFNDRESNLWIANSRGVTKVASFRFENYSKVNGLLDDDVSAICELSNGTMVFGHSLGFSFLSPADGDIHTLKISSPDTGNPSHIRIADICSDRQDNIWALVKDIGIIRMTPAMEIKWYKGFIPAGTESFDSSILVDGQGQIWASARDLLFKYDRAADRFVAFKTETKIPGTIRRIFFDKRKENTGSLCIVSSNGGGYRLEGRRVTPIYFSDPYDAHSVNAMFRDKEGNLLIGSNEGLFVCRDEKLMKFQLGQPEIDVPVYFITGDPAGNTWIGTNNGVFRWSGTAIRAYARPDGLAGNETHPGSGFVDRKGRVWIGTNMGVSCYNRDRDIVSGASPLLKLLYLDASGTRYSLDPGREIHLKSSQNDLTFHFRPVSFVDENAIKYNLRLEGFEAHWTTEYHSDKHQIRYPNLPSGKYRFRVQAVNSLGNPSAVVSSGSIVIEEPFAYSSWFYFFLFLIPILFLIVILNLYSKKSYVAKLEKQYHRRTQEMEASEKELRYIFNMAHDAIIIFESEDETVLDVNQRACNIYGFSRPEFIGMSLDTISKDVGKTKLMVNETVKRGDYVNFETVHYRKNGTEMILEVNASTIVFRGKRAILSINRDITQRKKAEQHIKKSLEEKEILLKEIHHRVKNNLQIILSLLDLQADKLENPEVIQVFQDSKNRIRSMALVHENLYQSGDLAHIDSYEYIQSVLDYFLATYGNLGDRISYKFKIDSFLLNMDIAIPVGLILTELLSNAFKHAFIHNKKGRLSVSFRLEQDEKLVLCVQDNGVGLPDEKSLQEKKSLGLQLVTLLTRQVGGTFEVIRRGGTTFNVILPYSNTLGAGKQASASEENGQSQE
ncbi:MAG: histidine kinase dimerization/phosphoacceptor domain -containing protein [Candidatus Omnitrophota bacterium]